MPHLLRGLRSGVVLFRTSPLATAAAVVALALGLGFSTTIYSIVHGATRSLPVHEPEQVVAVQLRPTGSPAGNPGARGLELAQWREAAGGRAALEAFETLSVNVSDAGDHSPIPERVAAARITWSTFEVLGVPPQAGRGFAATDGDPGAPRAVVISSALWDRRYGRDDVIGKVIRLDGVPHTVAGIMPERFGFPIRTDVWVPMAERTANPAIVQVWGRLDAGTSREALASLLQGSTDRTLAVDVIPFTNLETPREVVAALYVLLLAVSGVLLIACVNVANLFLARAAARARDTAVRLALGASRRVLLLEQTGEALLLTLLALGAGVWLAVAGTQLFAGGTSHIIEAYWVEFRVDGVVLAWASALALLAAVLAAVLPAVRAARTDVIHTLRDGAGATRRSAGRTSRVLMSAQVALACALLALTLLLGRTALAVQDTAWPFDADAVWSTNLSIPQTTLENPESRTRLLDRLDDELRSMPGARGALASALPGRGSGQWTFGLDTPPDSKETTGLTSLTLVSPDYFAVLGARALRGRLLDHSDRAGSPLVVVVNESFVRRHSPNQDPIGRRVVLGQRSLTIVGVVPDLVPNDLQDLHQDGIYGAISQGRPFAVRVVAAGAVSPRSLQDLVTRVDPDIPLYETFTVREAALRDKQILTVLSGLFALFGTGALTMTAIGLYSVMTLLVALRRREFGVRLALGATRRDLLLMVARQGGRQVAAGLTLGVLLGLGMATVFSSVVEAVAVDATGLVAGIIAAMAMTSAIALAVPTWTASRVDPITALRAD